MNDLISRREVSMILDKYRVPDSVYHEINKLPEFSADREKGEWIGDKDYPICSKCGTNFMDYVHYTEDAVCLKKPDFCPNCGADMRPEPYKKGE